MGAMTRSSPTVKRAAAILSFMASHPDQTFTLTELSRALRLSSATCHALLTALVEVGFLYRISSKSYVLGAEIAAIGRTARDAVSPLLIAQPELRALADKYDVVCSAGFFDGTNVEIRGRAASVSFAGIASPLGSLFKVRIPFAAVYLAWMSDEDVLSWLDAYAPPPSAEQRAQQLKAITFVRRHGYSLLYAQAQHADDVVQRGNTPMVPATELDINERYLVDAIVAPVFSVSNSIAFVLIMMGFKKDMTGHQIEAVAEDLNSSCSRISGFIQGRSGRLREVV